jgi:hypothetical protein
MFLHSVLPKQCYLLYFDGTIQLVKHDFGSNHVLRIIVDVLSRKSLCLDNRNAAGKFSSFELRQIVALLEFDLRHYSFLSSQPQKLNLEVTEKHGLPSNDGEVDIVYHLVSLVFEKNYQVSVDQCFIVIIFFG